MDSGLELYSYNMSCRTTATFTKRRNEVGDGRSSTTEECDSTTEPINSKVQFQVGEDVYYQDDTGKNVLGTVDLIQGKKVKVIFMDNTEKWAPLSRVKKISYNFNEDEEEVKPDIKFILPNSPHTSISSESSSSGGVSSGGGNGKKKNKCDLNGHAPKENYQVTCGSCGTQKMIAPKKAVEFSPYTTHQYNCRKCINKSKTNKNNGVPIIAAHFLAQARGRPRGADTNGTMTPNKGILEPGMTNGVFRPAEVDKICLHCRSPILERVSLHCTMCERPCHPSCLALTPPPLPGDTFWSIICHVCGTQKPDGSPENDSQKLYSSRRSITCWSDVALLLLSCLGCRNSNEKYFHLDKQVIPFWEENVTRLHLPRQYKTADPVERHRCLLVALKNAHLRFVQNPESDSWGILERTDLIKSPMVSAGRAVTAAGFPISVRANNPEAASAAMTNIAQTIAVQAAANKANNVPTPKNSPSNIPSRPIPKQVAANLNNASLGRKTGKQGDPVAKKSGAEFNFGAQRRNDGTIWSQSQSRYNGKGFSNNSDPPNKLTNASCVAESLPSSIVPNSQQQVKNHRIQSQQQHQHQPINSQQKHNVTLSPSPGGAARVTGMMISPSHGSTAPETGTTRMVNSGSYPVRKNGSPILNKSIRVETVERKNEADNKLQYALDGVEGRKDLVRDSGTTGVFNNNNIGQKSSSLKRKMSMPKSSDESSQDMSTAAKRLKIGLPSSTDVTSKRLPSPPKSVESDNSCVKYGQKKALSPLQKLSDLQRNGGLTVVPQPRVNHTETGFQTLPITSSNPGKTMDSNNEGALVPVGGTSSTVDDSTVVAISPEDKSSMFTTPVKSSHGATPKIVQQEMKAVKGEEGFDNTKEKSSNVTTTPSPRAFKLAAVSSPGSSKTSPVSTAMERRVRSARLKRSVVSQKEKEKQANQQQPVKPVSKKLTAKDKAAALTAAAVKNSRGRPPARNRPPLKLTLRQPNNRIVGYHGQFNGSVTPNDPSDNNELENNSIDESAFSWNNMSVSDLLDYGSGYRIGCLPKYPEGQTGMTEITGAALKHFKDELAPRPPSYWSTTSAHPHGKKPVNQKSRRDLKDADSYYICGRRIDQNETQYQVVWRDGYGFEYSSEDEEELGVDFGKNYIYFEDYDPVEYFRDKMPNAVSLDGGNCDSSSQSSPRSTTSTETSSSDKGGKRNNNGDEIDGLPVKDGFIHMGMAIPIKIKPEPNDSDKSKNKTPSFGASSVMGRSYAEMVTSGIQKSDGKTRNKNFDPMIIDLTDSP